MILLDTNVIIGALDKHEVQHRWALELVLSAVSGEGAVVSAVTVAELCAVDGNPEEVQSDLRNWGVQIADVPAVSAVVCGKAFRQYVNARRNSKGTSAPKVPLPDFFIGAHAEIMGWKIATRDQDRFRKCFPGVTLLTP